MGPTDVLDGPATSTDATLDARVRAAALCCIARTGVRRTTLDDIATEAGCSRASIYRAFPGGKDVVLAAAAEAEAERLLAQLARQIDAAGDLESALVAAVSGAARVLAGHEALQHLMVNEPGIVLPHLSFDGLDPLLARAVDFLAPFLERWVAAEQAAAIAEWSARVLCLYADPEAPLDLTDPDDAHRLVRTYLMPGIHHTEQEPTS